MRKAVGCLSIVGLIAALLLAVGVGTAVWMQGATLFSPGPLSARSGTTGPLQGYGSHADMASACERCHQPWAGADPARCLDCHTGVGDEIAGEAALHGRIDARDACTRCHPEHQGRDADLARARLDLFAHDGMGFVLVGHDEQADGSPFACEDCHVTGYTVPPAVCASCHRDLDAPFVAQHTAGYGATCLSCHTGQPLREPFEHSARFVLEGAHAAERATCIACHGDRSLGEIEAGCAVCHEEPEMHRGQFGDSCASCHTAQGWRPARLQAHAFPLDHGADADPPSCRTCHVTGYVTYTCYGCHEHQPADIAGMHRAQDIEAFQACVDCHPSGKGRA